MEIPADAKDQRQNNTKFEARYQTIHDIRGSTENSTLDENGFTIREFRSCLDSKGTIDRERVEGEYLPEVEHLIRDQVQGVDQVFFFEWRVRSITYCGFLRTKSWRILAAGWGCSIQRGASHWYEQLCRTDKACSSRTCWWVKPFYSPFSTMLSKVNVLIKVRRLSSTGSRFIWRNKLAISCRAECGSSSTLPTHSYFTSTL